MADKMMRIAGRTSDGIAKAVLVNSNGAISVDRPWGTVVTKILDYAITDDSWHHLDSTGTALDISEYPINSLRIRNTTGKAITIRFQNDLHATDHTYLESDGQAIEIALPSTSVYHIYTPQDLPILNYIKYIKIQFKANEVPSSGSLVIYHVGRK